MGRPLSAPKPLPDVETLNMYLRYDANDGKLFWKGRNVSTFKEVGSRTASFMHGSWNTKFAGKEAGSLQSGYMRCMIDGVHHMVHRLIWKMAHGNDPQSIDHIDGNRLNNRLSNLRDVSAQVNARNRKLYLNNTSEVPGVTFHQRDQVWQVRIGVGQGEEIHVGSYRDREIAIEVRLAVQSLLDYHANHGRKETP